MTWVRIKNHIAIRENDEIFHLEAEDVYTALKDDTFTIYGTEYPSPEKVFPDLIFSTISYEAQIELSSDGRVGEREYIHRDHRHTAACDVQLLTSMPRRLP